MKLLSVEGLFPYRQTHFLLDRRQQWWKEAASCCRPCAALACEKMVYLRGGAVVQEPGVIQNVLSWPVRLYHFILFFFMTLIVSHATSPTPPHACELTTPPRGFGGRIRPRRRSIVQPLAGASAARRVRWVASAATGQVAATVRRWGDDLRPRAPRMCDARAAAPASSILGEPSPFAS